MRWKNSIHAIYWNQRISKVTKIICFFDCFVFSGFESKNIYLCHYIRLAVKWQHSELSCKKHITRGETGVQVEYLRTNTVHRAKKTRVHIICTCDAYRIIPKNARKTHGAVYHWMSATENGNPRTKRKKTHRGTPAASDCGPYKTINSRRKGTKYAGPTENYFFLGTTRLKVRPTIDLKPRHLPKSSEGCNWRFSALRSSRRPIQYNNCWQKS